MRKVNRDGREDEKREELSGVRESYENLLSRLVGEGRLPFSLLPVRARVIRPQTTTVILLRAMADSSTSSPDRNPQASSPPSLEGLTLNDAASSPATLSKRPTRAPPALPPAMMKDQLTADSDGKPNHLI